MMKPILGVLILSILSCLNTNLLGQGYYRVSLLRAAPGELLQLIEKSRTIAEEIQQSGGVKPYIFRHSQGDSWDLMTVEYVGSNPDYSKKVFVPEYGSQASELVSFHQEMIVTGPTLETMKSYFDINGYFHIEMFVSLPGKDQELFREREMENAYLRELSRPDNLIFTNTFGASWDLFTVGAYRDLTHYAESALIPEEKEDEAAKQAGFESVSTIGSYLRSLILEHHDTLAVKIF